MDLLVSWRVTQGVRVGPSTFMAQESVHLRSKRTRIACQREAQLTSTNETYVMPTPSSIGFAGLEQLLQELCSPPPPRPFIRFSYPVKKAVRQHARLVLGPQTPAARRRR